jgi:hypothetical protein
VSRIPTWLRYVVIGANVLYILWIVRNAINEGFRGTPVEIVSMAGLLVLLSLDAVLLYAGRE